MPEATERTAGTAFAELVCADPEWARAEFDAIVAANFPAVPPRDRPRPPEPVPARRPSGIRAVRETPERSSERLLAARRWRGARSPPLFARDGAAVQ
ncbi:hypothetical protein GCM10027360_17500 [Amycolatopsis echigonensis]